MRAAIYARYSSELQSAASIQDQARLCQQLCTDQGWTVTEIFADEAISGSSHLRPQFQALQQAAMNGKIDVIVAEALDRLSRDQEHVAALYKRMQFLGVRIFTKSEGEINELHIGLNGTMSALFLKQLAQKTHRGLEGRVRTGKSAGGLSYGYRVNRQIGPDGLPTTGDLLVDDAEADVVRRIFRDYAAGQSARHIAVSLNREGVTGPRGGTWSFSTISGNWKRGTGILNNELYIGKRVWNRQRFVKDPVTQKRQARPNPESDWVTEEVPTLRLVTDDVWAAVKRRQGAIRDDILTARAANDAASTAPRSEGARRARYLFSGLLKCGCCGANYVIVNATHYGCAAARNAGTCTNRKSIARKEVEERVLDGLKHRLMHPDLVAEFMAEYRRAYNELRGQEAAIRIRAERELADVTRRIAKIIEAITDGLYNPSMKETMDALEARRVALVAELGALPEEEPVRIHPGLIATYHGKVADLATALSDGSTRGEAVELLRSLVDRIVVRPEEDGTALELFGELGAILALGEGANANARLMAGGSQLTVVAGVGFEPTTFRL